jgi:UDP-glucose 4-epimerase
MSASVLVVGGAGYIGSHMTKLLVNAGLNVTVFDNLLLGHRDAVVTDSFVQGDLLNKDDLKQVFQHSKFDVVMHFAAFAYVGESVGNPRKYYQNNVVGTLNLLDAMLDAGLDKFVFSSSCATYGIPQAIPITEDQPQNPINPYGKTKLMVEQILEDYAQAYQLNSVSLRYFNAAGCDPEGVLGERHDPETHLIPLVINEALRVQQGGHPDDTELCVYGDDFDTPDGTCIRDYIHVNDLGAAHQAAMEMLIRGDITGAQAYNLGNGQGFSVKQVIEACRRVTGVDIRYKVIERRAGDPPRLIGSAAKAQRHLGWRPGITKLDAILETAWRWFSARQKREFRPLR